MLDGRLFPLEVAEPLVFLGAIADIGIGLPFLSHGSWMRARVGDGGHYSYGNTFLMIAGLLNFLVILDAYDIGVGRK